MDQAINHEVQTAGPFKHYREGAERVHLALSGGTQTAGMVRILECQYECGPSQREAHGYQQALLTKAGSAHLYLGGTGEIL